MIKKFGFFGLVVIFSLGFVSCAGLINMKTPESLRGYDFTTIRQLKAMENYPEFYFREGPAQYLMTEQEKKIWKKIEKIKDVELRSSTQKEFLKWFWQRRDPSPFTPFNEFKEQFYVNVVYAQKNFRSEYGSQGYRSDRGKIFLILGAPDWESRIPFPAAQIRFEEENPGIFGFDRVEEILVWSYQKLEYFLGTPSYSELIYPAEIYFRKGYSSGWQQVVPLFSRSGEIVYLPIRNFLVARYWSELERAFEVIRKTYIIDKESKFVVPAEN